MLDSVLIHKHYPHFVNAHVTRTENLRIFNNKMGNTWGLSHTHINFWCLQKRIKLPSIHIMSGKYLQSLKAYHIRPFKTTPFTNIGTFWGLYGHPTVIPSLQGMTLPVPCELILKIKLVSELHHVLQIYSVQGG